jgi:HEAT repeat protein
LLEIACLIAAGQSPPASAIPTPDYRARNLLRDSLTSGNPEVRTQAVQALGLAALREPYMSQLEAMLADKDVGVRVATVASMVDLKNKRTVAALKKALDDDAPEVGFAAAKALWTLKDPAGREALLSVLAGEMKTSSGFITQQKRDALRMLHTPRTTFIFAVKQGIGFAPVPGLGTGISSLQGILSDPGVSGRAATALLLGTDKDPKVLRALRDALSDKDSSVRAAAVHSIALRNDPALEKDLVPLLEDKKEAVRVRAAAGYLRLEWIKSGRRSRVRKQANKQAPAASSKN